MTLVEYMRQQEVLYVYRQSQPIPEDEPPFPRWDDVDDPLIDELVGLFERIYAAGSAEDVTLRFYNIVDDASMIARRRWYRQQAESAQEAAREQFPAEIVEVLEPGLRTVIRRQHSRDSIKAYVLAMLDYQEDYDERPTQP